jgi:hypothetical protein
MNWRSLHRIAMERPLMGALGQFSPSEYRGRGGNSGPTLRDMRLRQSLKIRELQHALVAAGFVALDQQAEVLGLSRSTTWAVLQANHKCSGLSVGVISRMLSAPGLPPSVRNTILDYVAEKSAGVYGHPKQRLRKFVLQLQKKGIALPGVLQLATDRRASRRASRSAR